MRVEFFRGGIFFGHGTDVWSVVVRSRLLCVRRPTEPSERATDRDWSHGQLWSINQWMNHGRVVFGDSVMFVWRQPLMCLVFHVGSSLRQRTGKHRQTDDDPTGRAMTVDDDDNGHVYIESTSLTKQNARRLTT